MKDLDKIIKRFDETITEIATKFGTSLEPSEFSLLNRCMVSLTLEEKIDCICQATLIAQRKEYVAVIKRFGKYVPEIIYSKYPIFNTFIEEAVAKKKQAIKVTALKRQGKTLEEAEAEVRVQEEADKLIGNRIFGYARVSTKEQNLGRQIKSLEAYGVDMIFEEKISGKNTNRPQFKLMMDQVKEGDTIIVSELTRISRSTKDLMNLLSDLEDKGVKFKSIKEAWIDTTTASGKLMLTIFSGMAQFERELLLERQAEGIAVAKEQGTSFGVKLDDKADINTAIGLYQESKFSTTKICEMCHISRSTLYRRLRKLGLME